MIIMYLAYIIIWHGAKFTKHGSTFSSGYKKYIRMECPQFWDFRDFSRVR